MRLVRRSVALLALAAAAACAPKPVATAQPADLAAARRTWEARGPASYDYTFTISCFCVHRGDYAVEVRDGQVAAVRDPRTRESVADRVTGILTVDQLFEQIASAAGQGTPVRASYHPELGYPAEAEIGTLANDAGTLYRIADLRPVP